MVHVLAGGRGQLADDREPTLDEMKKNQRNRESFLTHNGRVTKLEAAMNGILIERTNEFLATTLIDSKDLLHFRHYLTTFYGDTMTESQLKGDLIIPMMCKPLKHSQR